MVCSRVALVAIRMLLIEPFRGIQGNWTLVLEGTGFLKVFVTTSFEYPPKNQLSPKILNSIETFGG